MKRTLTTLVATSALALCCTAVQAKPVLLKTPIAFGSNLPALLLNNYRLSRVAKSK